jgi:hypothetical protein
MYDSALTTLDWEVMLSRCQFLIEANLKVRRGEWTIAQAHYHYQRLEPFGFQMARDAQQLVDRWCGRLANQNRPTEQPGSGERTQAYETAREKFLEEWKDQFKAMHGSKPIYPAADVGKEGSDRG